MKAPERVLKAVNHEEPDRVPAFESAFTTSTGIVHPSGNTFVSFQAPLTADIDCQYSNAIVKVDVGLGVNVSGDTNDKLVFNIVQNETTELAQFTHQLMGPCLNAEVTIPWSDLVVVAPGDTIDVFAEGTGGANLAAQVIGGPQNCSWVAFTIESFEP